MEDSLVNSNSVSVGASLLMWRFPQLCVNVTTCTMASSEDNLVAILLEKVVHVFDLVSLVTLRPHAVTNCYDILIPVGVRAPTLDMVTCTTNQMTRFLSKAPPHIRPDISQALRDLAWAPAAVNPAGSSYLVLLTKDNRLVLHRRVGTEWLPTVAIHDIYVVRLRENGWFSAPPASGCHATAKRGRVEDVFLERLSMLHLQAICFCNGVFTGDNHEKYAVLCTVSANHLLAIYALTTRDGEPRVTLISATSLINPQSPCSANSTPENSTPCGDDNLLLSTDSITAMKCTSAPENSALLTIGTGRGHLICYRLYLSRTSTPSDCPSSLSCALGQPLPVWNGEKDLVPVKLIEISKVADDCFYVLAAKSVFLVAACLRAAADNEFAVLKVTHCKGPLDMPPLMLSNVAWLTAGNSRSYLAVSEIGHMATYKFNGNDLVSERVPREAGLFPQHTLPSAAALSSNGLALAMSLTTRNTAAMSRLNVKRTTTTVCLCVLPVASSARTLSLLRVPTEDDDLNLMSLPSEPLSPLSPGSSVDLLVLYKYLFLNKDPAALLREAHQVVDKVLEDGRGRLDWRPDLDVLSANKCIRHILKLAQMSPKCSGKQIADAESVLADLERLIVNSHVLQLADKGIVSSISTRGRRALDAVCRAYEVNIYGEPRPPARVSEHPVPSGSSETEPGPVGDEEDPTADKCEVCGAEVAGRKGSTKAAVCVNSHALPRCQQTLRVLATGRYRFCQMCGDVSMLRSDDESVAPLLITNCLFCDIPMISTS